MLLSSFGYRFLTISREFPTLLLAVLLADCRERLCNSYCLSSAALANEERLI